MSRLSQSLPPITEDFLNQLDRIFPRIAPEPGVTTMEDLMYNAGQRKVIDWIKEKTQ